MRGMFFIVLSFFVTVPSFAELADGNTAGGEPRVEKQTPIAEMPRGVVQLDETVISGNQELPKVLYILPWREPGGLPDIELDAQFAEMDVFRRLYPPAYRRELSHFKTLDGTDSKELKE